MTHTSLRMLGLVLGIGALLTACGGDVSEVAPGPVTPPTVADTDVPVTATQSSAGAVGFVRKVVEDPDENGTGLRIDAADLATSESDEPEPDA